MTNISINKYSKKIVVYFCNIKSFFKKSGFKFKQKTFKLLRKNCGIKPDDLLIKNHKTFFGINKQKPKKTLLNFCALKNILKNGNLHSKYKN